MNERKQRVQFMRTKRKIVSSNKSIEDRMFNLLIDAEFNLIAWVLSNTLVNKRKEKMIQ